MEEAVMFTPDNLPELREALGQATTKSKILAGGTDLVLAIHQGRCKPDLLIDLSGVEELKLIKLTEGRIHIGAMATFTQIMDNQLIKGSLPCLREAASLVGSNQIRSAATIGGNIGNASPAGDTIPVLMALDAVVRVLDSSGQAVEQSIDRVISGAGRTSLRRDQVITEIIIPLPGEHYRSTFVKIGSRTAVTIAKLNMALAVKYDETAKSISDVRVALGAIGTKAFRERRVEGILNGRRVDQCLADTLAEELSVAVQEAIPGRYSLPYKREAVKGLAQSAFANLFPEWHGDVSFAT